jgi:DNA polymerase III gamma/tau subunit
MDSIFEHYQRTGYLHHAHIIEGGAVESVPALLLAVQQYLGIVTGGNPNIMVVEHASFGVDEARSLKEAQIQSAFGGGIKVFIVSTQSFTREAQNALLKTFEEPTADTHFFIIVPQLNTILPTLKSRVIMVASKNPSSEDETKTIAQKFLDSSLAERFAIAKKITVASKGLTRHDFAGAAPNGLARHDFAKSKGEQVDREKIRRILDHIERILYVRKSAGSSNDIFREIFQAKTYLADRGSSPNMLLEHLAIAFH